jgi:uncharacterized protein YdhG (YjbR/CyaY superfamily)
MSDRHNPEVDAWFARTDNPLKAQMMGIRNAILEADARITEVVKWSTPTFSYDGTCSTSSRGRRSS